MHGARVSFCETLFFTKPVPIVIINIGVLAVCATGISRRIRDEKNERIFISPNLSINSGKNGELSAERMEEYR